MELRFSPAETALLERILQQFVSDVPLEIGKTENYAWRQDLKADEAMAKEMLDRLRSRSVAAHDDAVVVAVVAEETVIAAAEMPEL